MKHDISQFDAPFFHITEQEAIAMGELCRLFSQRSWRKSKNNTSQTRNSDSY